MSFITENAQKLVEQYPELEKYGLWVVKVTFATKQCSNIVWSTAGKKVSIGFMASVAGVGGIGPSGEWYEEHGEEAWQKFRADVRIPFISKSITWLATNLIVCRATCGAFLYSKA